MQGDHLRGTGQRVGLVAAALVVLAAGYYAFAVVRARQVTLERIGAALVAAAGLEPEDLSETRLEVLLAVQDPRFFEHRGWDFAGGTMTTITQALVKAHYFEDFRPGIAKIEQSLIARFALDPLVSKRDQLRLFLATVYLGTYDGMAVNGLPTGADFFFGVPLAELSDGEFLSLVAMLDAPNALDPKRHPEANARRVRQMERLLAGDCERGGLFGWGPDCWSEDPSGESLDGPGRAEADET